MTTNSGANSWWSGKVFLRSTSVRSAAGRAFVLGLILAPLFSVCLFASAGPASAGPVYVFKNADGSTRISSRPPDDGGNAEVFRGYGGGAPEHFSGKSRAALTRMGKRKSDKYRPFIAAAARSYRLDPALITAVIHVESDFKPTARSPKGARGLMQIMPETGARLGLTDPFNPKDNIDAGARYLADLKNQFPKDERLVLAAYNAGEGAVAKHGGVPPYAETRDYVRKVLELRDWYRDQEKRGEGKRR